MGRSPTAPKGLNPSLHLISDCLHLSLLHTQMTQTQVLKQLQMCVLLQGLTGWGSKSPGLACPLP